MAARHAETSAHWIKKDTHEPSFEIEFDVTFSLLSASVNSNLTYWYRNASQPRSVTFTTPVLEPFEIR